MKHIGYSEFTGKYYWLPKSKRESKVDITDDIMEILAAHGKQPPPAPEAGEEEAFVAYGKACFYRGFEKATKDDANCFTAWREEAAELISRWRGEQGDGNMKCEYCGQKYHGEEPKGCCSGRDCGCMGLPINGPFVCSKGCYEMLMKKHHQHHPCGARWVRASASNWPSNWNDLHFRIFNDKEKINTNDFLEVENVGIKKRAAFFTPYILEYEELEYLSESDESTPCLPTREEAKKWANENYKPDFLKYSFALAMYDWIAERLNNIKK